jgi:hypothetical protein
MTRIRAWLLLATFVATLGSSELNADHFGVTDTACGDTSLAARSDAAKFANPSDAETGHCPVCHFLRAVSGANTASMASVALQDGAVTRPVTVAAVPPTVHPVTQPSRGPPVLPSSHEL